MDLDTVIARAKRVACEVLGPASRSVDEERRWPESGIRALQDMRLTGLTVPEAQGGLGHGLLALARVCEELGRECASTSICFGMHAVGAAVIAAKATSIQQHELLSSIAEGKHITSLALSEPGTGTYFYYPQTKLSLHGEASLVLSGAKCFVTNGGHANSYVVSTVSADRDAPPGHFSCVVLPMDTKGMQWGPAWSGVGMRGNSSRSLQLDDVQIPRENLLGNEGDQIWYVFNVITPYFLVAMAGTYLGVASAALDDARSNLQERRHEHSGALLAENHIVQHRLGQTWATVARTRALLYRAASKGDAGDPDALITLFSAKAEVADCAVDVVGQAITLSGGRGYRDGSRLHRMLRDVQASHIMAPTTDTLRSWTGRALLGRPILGE